METASYKGLFLGCLVCCNLRGTTLAFPVNGNTAEITTSLQNVQHNGSFHQNNGRQFSNSQNTANRQFYRGSSRQSPQYSVDALYHQTITLYNTDRSDVFLRHVLPDLDPRSRDELLWLLEKRAFEHNKVGKHSESIVEYSAVIDALRNLHGENNVRTLRIMRNRALALYHEERYEDALREYTAVVELSTLIHGFNDINTLLAMDDRALILIKLGRYEAAKVLLETILNLTTISPESKINLESSDSFLNFELVSKSEQCIETLTDFEQVVDFADKINDVTNATYFENQRLDSFVKLREILIDTENKRDTTNFETKTVGHFRRDKVQNLISEIRNKIARLHLDTTVCSETVQEFLTLSQSRMNHSHVPDSTYNHLHAIYEIALVFGRINQYRRAVTLLDKLIASQEQVLGSNHVETWQAKHYKILLLQRLIENAKVSNPVLKLMFEEQASFIRPRNNE